MGPRSHLDKMAKNKIIVPPGYRTPAVWSVASYFDDSRTCSHPLASFHSFKFSFASIYWCWQSQCKIGSYVIFDITSGTARLNFHMYMQHSLPQCRVSEDHVLELVKKCCQVFWHHNSLFTQSDSSLHKLRPQENPKLLVCLPQTDQFSGNSDEPSSCVKQQQTLFPVFCRVSVCMVLPQCAWNAEVMFVH